MKEFLSKIHKVNDSILEEYISHWTEYIVPKKTIMTASGDTERFIYYVQEGIQKSYYLNESKQHIIAFAYAPSFSGIPESFFTQTPSKYFLETITDSKFLRLSFEKHQLLMQEHREIETLFRKTTELFLMGMIQRHHELMAFDIETRFKTFVQRSSHLLNMVSQKDLASYLRIDSTNFSKLINSIHI
ncbi:Crp/Fnr family transcriptional regulator [Aquimarina sediminis]|uniref:Crp/Fnr family transcriptional regulator n=1 Tax=Aquimarina sediminis TaxID=2070536 RepID=UPI000CA05EDE|nr:Crp/Fnr family transcriptional regulator [Aquimarina sediminis]